MTRPTYRSVNVDFDVFYREEGNPAALRQLLTQAI